MFWFKLRPTFTIEVPSSRQAAIEKLRDAYAQLNQTNSFTMFGEYGELHLPVAEHRLWSPHLSFYVAERGQASLIHGRFAPRLDVWTFVWIVYLAMSFSAFFGLALAYSQWMLDESMWGLAVAVLGIAVVITMTLVAAIGQQWSSDQMHALRNRLEGILRSTELLAD